MTGDFWQGFVVGAIAAAVFSRVLREYLRAIAKAREFFRPQTVILPTPHTPAQKLSGCVVGVLKLLLLLLLIALVWLLLDYLL